MKFSDIPGHEDVKQRLRQMVDSGRLPHAIVLEGPPGIGKMMLARAMAQYIHCQRRHDGDSCGKCPQCHQHEAHNNLDTFYSFPVVKRGSGKTSLSKDFMPEFTQFIDEHPLMDMDQWLARLENVNAQPAMYVEEGEELTRAMSLTAQVSEHKVVVMWLPERMQEATANKLLKLVEEPFPDTVFIMTSDHPQRILPTIYSRVQRVPVRRFTTDELTQILIKNYGLASTEAAEAARLGEGSILGALKVSQGAADNAQALGAFQEVMRDAFTRNLSHMKAWAANQASLGREGAVAWLRYAQHLVRENYLLSLQQPSLQRLTATEKEWSQRFSPYVNERNVEAIMALFDEAITDIQGNANGKIVFFDTALRLAMLIKK